MPRTVESIVACHHAAAARRRAGKSPWALTLRLKGIISEYAKAGDDLTAEQAIEMSHRIARLLKGGVPTTWRSPENDNYNIEFEDLIEKFEQAEASDFTPTKEWPESPCEVINSWLDELYDWGDRY